MSSKQFPGEIVDTVTLKVPGRPTPTNSQTFLDTSIALKTRKLSEYIEKVREYNESNKLSFYDDKGNRYINSIYDYFLDGKSYFKLFLSRIKEFYKHIRRYPQEQDYTSADVRYQFINKYLRIKRGDFDIIDSIFYDTESLDILKHNHYNFFRPNRRYRNEIEKKYCQAVTEVLTEIMIKIFNFQRYCKAEDNHVDWLFEEIRKNYTDHVNEANSSKTVIKNKVKIEGGRFISM